MSRANDAAYPVMPPLNEAGRSANEYPYPDAGMTLRERVAIAAMQGILAGQSGWPDRTTFDEIAMRSVKQADALIAELAKKEPQA